MKRSLLIPINRWHWCLVKKKSLLFWVSKEKKSFQSSLFLSALLVKVFQWFSSSFLLLYNWIFSLHFWAKNHSHSVRSCKREVCGLFDHLVTCTFFMLRSLLCRGLDWWEFGTPVLCRPPVIFFVDIVEILHEGGDVEQWLEPRNKFLVFAIGFLIAFIALHFYLVISLVCTSLHPFHLLAFFGLYSSQQESNYAPQLII